MPKISVDVVVQPGDTLWGLARQYAPDLEPRESLEWVTAGEKGYEVTVFLAEEQAG